MIIIENKNIKLFNLFKIYFEFLNTIYYIYIM